MNRHEFEFGVNGSGFGYHPDHGGVFEYPVDPRAYRFPADQSGHSHHRYPADPRWEFELPADREFPMNHHHPRGYLSEHHGGLEYPTDPHRHCQCPQDQHQLEFPANGHNEQFEFPANHQFDQGPFEIPANISTTPTHSSSGRASWNSKWSSAENSPNHQNRSAIDEVSDSGRESDHTSSDDPFFHRDQFAPSWTSPLFRPITSDQLDRSTRDLARKFKILVERMEIFQRFSRKSVDIEHAGDQLDELRGKFKPAVLNLDEDVLELMEEIKSNVNRCRIGDQRLSILLGYNKHLQEIRDQSRKLMTNVIDQLESRLTVVSRGGQQDERRGRGGGAGGVSLSQVMNEISKMARKIECDSAMEREKHGMGEEAGPQGSGPVHKPPLLVTRSVSWGDTPRK